MTFNTRLLLWMPLMAILTQCNTKTVVDTGCYSYQGDGNSIVLEVTATSPQVSGTLQYALKEKDANTGTFTGEIIGDILYGHYTYRSEGGQGEREVAFKVKGDYLLEGYGPLDDSGTAFIDRDNIFFPTKMPLHKSPCNP